MAERERGRVREREFYEQIIAAQRADRERSFTGEVIIRGRHRPWELSRQGLVRNYMQPSCYTGRKVDTALDGWIVFTQEVKVHSGKHRHQGGLVIYILEGEGHSIVDGERLEWEAGDLMLLPIKHKGVEHQHFNLEPGKPCVWIAFVYIPIMDHVAMEFTQISNSPDFKG